MKAMPLAALLLLLPAPTNAASSFFERALNEWRLARMAPIELPHPPALDPGGPPWEFRHSDNRKAAAAANRNPMSQLAGISCGAKGSKARLFANLDPVQLFPLPAGTPATLRFEDEGVWQADFQASTTPDGVLLSHHTFESSWQIVETIRAMQQGEEEQAVLTVSMFLGPEGPENGGQFTLRGFTDASLEIAGHCTIHPDPNVGMQPRKGKTP